jgi:toxin FitB
MIDSKHLLDSSAWLAYFFAEKNEAQTLIEDEGILLTSVVSLFEVKRKLLRDKVPPARVEKVMLFIMERSIIIDIDDRIADGAVGLSLKHDLGMADALIYASALQERAVLVTGDNDFRGLSQVIILSTRK